jgi:hypothetical protein
LTKERFELVGALVLVWFVAFLVVPFAWAGGDAAFPVFGPDSFMRLERAAQLFETWNWYETRIAGAAAPEGADLHWTRPVDLYALGLAAPFVSQMDVRNALEFASILFPLSLSLSLLLAGVWALYPLVRRENLLLAALSLGAQTTVQNYFWPGRVDHHSIVALCTALLIGFFVRCSAPDNTARKNALLAGVVAGSGLWLSLEFLIVLVPFYLTSWLCWVRGNPSWLSIARDFSLAIFCTCLFAILVEAPPKEWFDVHYDKISVAQVGLVFCPLFFWWSPAKHLEQRPNITFKIVGSALYGLLSLTACGLLMPQIFRGPISATDPRIIGFWVDSVTEMQSTFGSLPFFLEHCATSCIAVLLCTCLVLRQRDERLPVWDWLLPVLIFLSLAGAFHVRTALYMQVTAALTLVVFFDAAHHWIEDRFDGWRRSLLVIGSICAVLLAPALFASALAMENDGVEATPYDPTQPITQSAGASDARPECRVPELATYLSSPHFLPSHEVATLANFINDGPEIVFTTRHSVVSVPFHRNGDAIFDGYRLLATSDEREARTIIAKRGITHIVICLARGYEAQYYLRGSDEPKLFRRLATGDMPAWVQRPAVVGSWRVFPVTVSPNTAP